MDERLKFVRDALSDRFTMSELCARYGVSRRVGYKWLARYDAEGRRGLMDRSRAPHRCPHKVPAAVAGLLVVAREAHRTLKRQAVKPVRASCAAQQRNFDAFRREYNTGRPHERLQQETPASRYRHSPRPYPERLPGPEYRGHFLVRRSRPAARSASRTGYCTSPGRWSMKRSDSRRPTTVWAIHYNTVLLATFDVRDSIITG